MDDQQILEKYGRCIHCLNGHVTYDNADSVCECPKKPMPNMDEQIRKFLDDYEKGTITTRSKTAS